MSNPPLCRDLSLEAHENISLASSERLDWRGDTAAMFLFSHQSFPPLRTASSVSANNQLTVYSEALQRPVHSSSSRVQRCLVMAAVKQRLEINDRCSESVNQGLCVEWEFDRCTINSFTASWDKYTLLSIEEERCIETAQQNRATDAEDQMCRCVSLVHSPQHLCISVTENNYSVTQTATLMSVRSVVSFCC